MEMREGESGIAAVTPEAGKGAVAFVATDMRRLVEYRANAGRRGAMRQLRWFKR